MDFKQILKNNGCYTEDLERECLRHMETILINALSAQKKEWIEKLKSNKDSLSDMLYTYDCYSGSNDQAVDTIEWFITLLSKE